MKKNTKAANCYMAVILCLTYVPILLTIFYSFNESRLTTQWTGFSLKWYRELAQDADMMEALGNSLILALLSCLGAGVIGTLGAYGMHKVKWKANNVVEYISMIPIMIPEIILGMVFLAVFSFMGLPFGMTTLVIAHTSFCIPYIFMQVKASLSGMDASLEEAARDLGATPFRAFIDIILPLVMPAVMSGMLLAFAMSFDDVVISVFVTGPKVNTLPLKIYTKMKTGITPEINALALVMLFLTAGLLFLSGLIGRRGKRRRKAALIKQR